MIDKYNYNDEPSGRVDTLAMALDKCERLEKQLKMAKRAMNKAYKLLHNFATSEAQIVLQRTYFRIKKLEELEK